MAFANDIGAWHCRISNPQMSEITLKVTFMNSLIREEFPLRDTQSLRYDLLDMISDADLEFRLPGNNPSLGRLCCEIGEVEHAYIDSFETMRIDWSWRHPDPIMASSVDRLRSWYLNMDSQFETVIARYTDDELNAKTIDRGEWSPSAYVQFQIYREALLIFFARSSVYIRALAKPYNAKWKKMIG
ncbi:hypothetical protein B5P46_08420 [Rhizobium leguminosarum]|uniref:Uncharacterized protein n=2 Tax=Rhizobium leguminosarum TaxID=384 RepID=A0A4Q1UA93_RHILE|nr:hypothetical protein B5P46_08420 [Rhizobium leguminosarum]